MGKVRVGKNNLGEWVLQDGTDEHPYFMTERDVNWSRNNEGIKRKKEMELARKER